MLLRYPQITGFWSATCLAASLAVRLPEEVDVFAGIGLGVATEVTSTAEFSVDVPFFGGGTVILLHSTRTAVFVRSVKVYSFCKEQSTCCGPSFLIIFFCFFSSILLRPRKSTTFTVIYQLHCLGRVGTSITLPNVEVIELVSVRYSWEFDLVKLRLSWCSWSSSYICEIGQ